MADPTTTRVSRLEVHEFPAERLARLANGVVLITKLDAVPTKNPNVIRTTLTLAGNDDLADEPDARDDDQRDDSRRAPRPRGTASRRC